MLEPEDVENLIKTDIADRATSAAAIIYNLAIARASYDSRGVEAGLEEDIRALWADLIEPAFNARMFGDLAKRFHRAAEGWEEVYQRSLQRLAEEGEPS